MYSVTIKNCDKWRNVKKIMKLKKFIIFFHKHQKHFSTHHRRRHNHSFDYFSIFLVVLFLYLLPSSCVDGGCREEDDTCDPICVFNGTTTNCNLRAVVILPNSTNLEASLSRVLPVLELAVNKSKELGLFPEYLNIKWHHYDDKCDASYATISAMDGHTKDCADVLFGPSCDYALASVSRIAKYFRSDGTPVVTVGGYTHDFVNPKTACKDEYHMLVRTGLLSYKSIADLTIAVMRHYNWSRVVYFYERNGHYNVAGLHTCHLVMNTLATFHRESSITYSSFVTDSAVANMTENLKREVGLDNANLFLGPICNYVLAPVSRYAGVWEIPVATSGGLAEAFSQSTQFPTLTRMMGSYGQVSVALRGILLDFNWHITALLYHNYGETSGKGHSDCFNSLGAVFRAVNSTAYHKNFDEDVATADNFKEMLETVMTKARIVIMCANPSTIREIMLAAEELKMVSSGEYVFFNIELFSSMSATTTKPWFNETDTPERNARAMEAYNALLTVIAKQPDQNEYMAFSEEVKSLAKEKYNYEFNEDEPVSTFVTAFYDAVLLYAYALRDYLNEDVNAFNKTLNGTRMAHLMWNSSFKGITGNVIIDNNGDRISDYSLLDMNPETGYFEVIANYYHDKKLQYVEGKSIYWAGGRSDAPPDKPFCGFDGSLCPDNSLPGYAILSLVLAFAIVIMGIISILGYRHYKLEAEINSMTWKVFWNDVLPCNPTNRHRGSVHSLGKRGSILTVNSEDIGSFAGDRQLYIPVGFYKGNKVAIKPIEPNNINLNRDLMLELKRMKDIQHDHLVRFYGACVEPPNCCILTEYCPKGSLQDILENEQIKLDWMFKLSLMHDIVRGMHFLHSTDIHSHGSLKSSNCVVDSRFVLKITDFGLYDLRKSINGDDDIENKNSYAYWKRLLWTAPELLRTVTPPPKGTQKGDVYSFAIIVHEIVTRQGPFYLGCDDKSPQEIVQLVRNGPKTFGEPFRPTLEDINTTYEDINNIMTRCWHEEPGERPDFHMLKIAIRKINKENESGNILDNLLQRMEQYANNLESLVEDRTRDYLEEKKKCEELLYQLLPKSVAATLILGKPVIAETYDQVTIYFSDIVGFTSISAQSTPMQVVDLLNDLYTCFDSIVENFDVYKVETIGDAYMVVSGLPVRNGNLHGREIARMALALLNAVYKFTIRHRPNEQLRLRIGLHSGPCVAGVVGLKMPRYCLFGDTVNTASRMESNGEALKIHVSESTKNILDFFGTFEMTKRGLVEMKGKGAMLTYWLTGEKIPTTPVIKSLPLNGNVGGNEELNNHHLTGNGNALNLIPNEKISNSISYNFVKTNNIKNNQFRKKCSLGEDNIRTVTQPLLAKINT